jgi:endonuclease I
MRPSKRTPDRHPVRPTAGWLAVLVLLALAGPPAGGDPPAGYYATVDSTNAATLRTTLHEAIDDHTRISYANTWAVLEEADQDPNDAGHILDLYKNASYEKVAADRPYQREHTWPNSYGFPHDVVSNYPYPDCHALFLADGSYNASRSNNPFRFCDDQCTEKPTEVNNGQGGGSGVYPGNSNWRTGSGTDGTWETWSGRRGDVARALFYLDVRYEGGTHGGTGYPEPNLYLTDDPNMIATSGGVNASVAYMGMLSVLRQWAAQDPVDGLERHRNDVVFAAQGNRNPFIDHPEWVECLYGGVCAGGGEPLELLGGRFRITVAWDTPQGGSGVGHPVALTDETGYFWFFQQQNVEVLVKVHDACNPPFNHFWVFAAGLTNVHVVLTVEDTVGQAVHTYENTQGTPFAPIQDTGTFATCDAGSGTAPTAEFQGSYRRSLSTD